MTRRRGAGAGRAEAGLPPLFRRNCIRSEKVRQQASGAHTQACTHARARAYTHALSRMGIG